MVDQKLMKLMEVLFPGLPLHLQAELGAALEQDQGGWVDRRPLPNGRVPLTIEQRLRSVNAETKRTAKAELVVAWRNRSGSRMTPESVGEMKRKDLHLSYGGSSRPVSRKRKKKNADFSMGPVVGPLPELAAIEVYAPEKLPSFPQRLSEEEMESLVGKYPGKAKKRNAKQMSRGAPGILWLVFWDVVGAKVGDADSLWVHRAGGCNVGNWVHTNPLFDLCYAKKGQQYMYNGRGEPLGLGSDMLPRYPANGLLRGTRKWSAVVVDFPQGFAVWESPNPSAPLKECDLRSLSTMRGWCRHYSVMRDHKRSVEDKLSDKRAELDFYMDGGRNLDR